MYENDLKEYNTDCCGNLMMDRTVDNINNVLNLLHGLIKQNMIANKMEMLIRLLTETCDDITLAFCSYKILFHLIKSIPHLFSIRH